MRAALYWNYSTRSLRRGGQRTVLAVFCIAVGVMAIVALQLASLMVSNNLTGNVRQANGGDLSARNDVIPFQQQDIAYFRGLVRSGKATGVTALTTESGTVYHGDQTYPAAIGIVADPAHYPLVGQPSFANPTGGDMHRLLAAPDNMIVSADVAKNLGVGIGGQVTVSDGRGRSATGHVTGITRSNSFSGNADIYIQRGRFASSISIPLGYSVFDLTTASDAQSNATATLIKRRYPLATVQTVADALKQRQEQVSQMHEYLQVVGILALLIGGFGVVNTMNVLLARRRIEIAMLKTAGYRRGDLYGLFGLEAALLGIMGGVVGAIAGTALSYLVKTLIENAFQLQLPFVIDPVSVGMGVVVGLCTAIIFGLQPIARAAQVRPQAVLRDSPERGGWGAFLSNAVLFLVLSVLFCALAGVILGDALVGVIVVYGTFIVLGIFGLIFGVLIWLLSRLPIPERLSPRSLLFSTLALLVSLLVARVLLPIGVVLVALSLLSYVVAVLPRSWKATIKMALRDVGRQRTRATMTLLALFVGVFCVGLMVVLGQDVQQKIQDALAGLTDYNVVTLAPAQSRQAVDDQIHHHIGGLKNYQVVNAAQDSPLAVNGRPLTDYIGNSAGGRGRGGLGRNGTLAYLSGLTGYDLRRQAVSAPIPLGDGRALRPSDAGTANVLMPTLLHFLPPLRLKVGDTVTVGPFAVAGSPLGGAFGGSNDASGAGSVTLHIVGFYTVNPLKDFRYPILASTDLVHRFGGPAEQLIYTFRIDPNQANAAVGRIDRYVPGTTSLNLTSLSAIVDQILGNLVILLVALASLALFAGIIIIANAVALAMLERRREQGILKSVGYTSRRVLGGVLVENGVIGGLGGVLGMVMVAIATTVLAKTLFKLDLAVPTLTALALIALVTVIALLTAALVAWTAVRVRPLEVLRYE